MITLSKVTLKNFKVYGGEPYTINFEDNRLVLLDGPNGYGKTSVFDAIELALTGTIRRLLVLESRQNPSDIVVAHNGDNNVVIVIEFLSEDGNKRVFQRSLKPNITNAARRISNFSDLWEIKEIIDDMPHAIDGNTFNVYFNSKDFSRDFWLFHYIEQEETSRFLKSNSEAQRAEELSKLFGDTVESEQKLQKLTDIKKKLFSTRRNIRSTVDNIKSLHNLSDIDNFSASETEQHIFALPWLTGEKTPFWDHSTVTQLNEQRLNKALTELDKIRALCIYREFFLRSRRYHRAAQERELIELYIGYSKTYSNYQNIEADYKNYQLVKRSSDILSSGDLKLISKNLEVAPLYFLLGLGDPETFITSIESVIELADKSKGLTSIYTELLKHHKGMHESIQAQSSETACGLCGHDYGSHEALNRAIIDHGYLLRTELGDKERILVTARELFESNHTLVLSKACTDFLSRRDPPSQIDLSRIAKAAASAERLERLRKWLASEKISEEDLVAQNFPVIGGESYISEKADVLSERIRSRVGPSPEEYHVLFSEDIYERTYTEYFEKDHDKLRSFDSTVLDKKENFLKARYFSSLTEIAAQLLKLEGQEQLLDVGLADTTKLIDVVNNQIGQYRKKLITDIEIPFYIYSGKILQSHQAGLGQGVFIKDPLGNDVLKNVRLVSDWKTDHDIMNTMSSGQISAVVIALTLALNRVYATNFSTILIDDPVQTMDDINMSSLVELLRNDFSDRQIILSTHEEKVARYFTYKYIKHSGKVKIINLMQRKEYVPTNSYVYRGAIKPEASSAG